MKIFRLLLGCTFSVTWIQFTTVYFSLLLINSELILEFCFSQQLCILKSTSLLSLHQLSTVITIIKSETTSLQFVVI